MAKAELVSLARGLRARLELSDEADWAPGTGARAPSRAAAGAAPPKDAGSAARLSQLAAEIGACRRCPLGASRLQAVPGVGSGEAGVMFIGEGPGYSEDHRGEPFVGRSGQLLDKILESIGLSRRTVFIANVVKCHPMKDPADPEARGNDRPPTPEEMEACRPFLDEQIRLLSPRVVVTLGAVAARALLGAQSLTAIRGQWRLYEPAGREGRPIKVLPTYHPAALLRNPNLKKDVWTDMKRLKGELAAS